MVKERNIVHLLYKRPQNKQVEAKLWSNWILPSILDLIRSEGQFISSLLVKGDNIHSTMKSC